LTGGLVTISATYANFISIERYKGFDLLHVAQNILNIQKKKQQQANPARFTGSVMPTT
jgi:hypothetical protein